MRKPRGRPWLKGQSGNPKGRPVGTPNDHEYFRRLRIGLLRKVEVPIEVDPVQKAEAEAKGEKVKATRTVDEMMLIVEAVIAAAKRAEPWAVEHIAQRVDGKVREQVELTTNTNVKVRYESFEEVRAALLEEGINVDKLPLLTDMRPPEGEERN
jgi:Family of unknown function (DUF5681)